MSEVQMYKFSFYFLRLLFRTATLGGDGVTEGPVGLGRETESGDGVTDVRRENHGTQGEGGQRPQEGEMRDK